MGGESASDESRRELIDDTLPSDEILNSFQRPGSHLNAKAYATRIDTHTLPSVQESRNAAAQVAVCSRRSWPHALASSSPREVRTVQISPLSITRRWKARTASGRLGRKSLPAAPSPALAL